MTGVHLPTALPQAGAWQVADWRTIQRASAPAAAGVASIEFPQLSSDEQWLIDHVVAQCASTKATSLRLYDTTVGVGGLLSGTTNGNLNEADYPSGLLLRSSSSLIAQWTNASDGAIGTLTLQARVLRRAGG